MRKKIVRITAGLFLFAAFMIPTSCEFGDECAWCTLITDNDGEVTEGIPLYYCDETLNKKRSSTPVTIRKITTYWECD